MNYNLGIVDGKIYFENNSVNFVEVVFTVNGRDIKFNRPFDYKTRGYCYPAGYRKEIKAFSLSGHGEIEAYVYAGSGEYSYGDLDVPPFIRFKINELNRSGARIAEQIKTQKKVKFDRNSNTPSSVLKLRY